jgi:guanylate kinase
MSEKQEKIIILGHSGSGKDFLRKKLVEMGLKYQPKFTTRPIRLNEKQGEDYDYIDFNLYVELHKNNKIKTHQSFIINNVNWYYGITKENWHNNQVFIMTTEELNQIPESDRKNCFVVYLKIDKSIREKRILERNDSNDSVKRRIEADEKDFEGFKDYDLCITDEEFEPEMVYELMN